MLATKAKERAAVRHMKLADAARRSHLAHRSLAVGLDWRCAGWKKNA